MSGHQEFEYHVNVLGPISVVGPQGAVDPGGTKPRLLLALLVANAGAMLTTERLIDGLWGDDPPPTARKAVHVHVSNLRRALGSSFPLQTTRTGYRIDRDQLAIDAVRFESGVARGRALIVPSPAEAADVLATAVQLWSGPAYADVADEEAIRPEALRLTELRLMAIEHRIEADLRLGRHAALLGELETLTIDNPFRERLRELQMLALYRSGRQTDALRTYERTRRTLAEELGLDPGPALRSLQQQILEQSTDLDLVATSPNPATVAAGGLGGRSVRGYELRERLGGHGNGCVYRAYQAALGREVALRLIPPGAANQPDFVKRFETSCQRVAELGHPHIVGLLDYWRDPDGAYVAMPLLRGGSLERACEQSPWSTPLALRLIEQVGSALAYAHRHGVTHGDVRTSNVLLDEDANGYLSDFVIDECGVASATRLEQATSVPDDIEKLALMTCTILTGTAPHDAPFTRTQLPAGFSELMGTAIDPNPARRFQRVEDYLRALRQCFGIDSVSTLEPRPSSETRNPFKGLRAFREADASDFFGRDELVREIQEQVTRHGLTAVVGPSGSGKSSLVRAGLVPACRLHGLGTGRDVVVAEMLPGRYPFEELQSALMGVAVDRPSDLLAELGADDRGLLRAAKRILPDDATDLLLIVDQFEELFALTADETVRRAFLANLRAVACDDRHRVRVVVTLRADFFDRPLLYPDFGEVMKQSIITVALPGESSLAEAIGQPARRVGLEVEPGLIPTILRDVDDQPGSLPMLQYSLTELFEARVGNLLTIDAYRRTGGVVGALATRAEEIFRSLTPSGRDVAREVFVRLVSVGDDSEDTRRRVRRSELEALGVDLATLETVISAFGSFRLLTFDHDPVTRGPTVEVAHEALIREWPRYREWVDERRDDLRAERRLAAATGEWLVSDRDPSFLVGGVQLERYERWIDESTVRLTADQRAFIEESHDDERRRHERTATRRRRVLVGTAMLSIVALIAAGVAVVQRHRAGDQARAANEAVAEAESLRADADRAARRNNIEAQMPEVSAQTDPDLELLLALASYEQLQADGFRVPAVTSELYQAVFDQLIAARIPAAQDSPIEVASPVAASPDGTMFVVNAIRDAPVVVDAATGAVVSRLETPSSAVVAAAWNRPAEQLMVGRYDGFIDLWDPHGTLLDSVAVSTQPAHPVWPLVLRDGVITFEEFPSSNFAENMGAGGIGTFRVKAVDTATGEPAFESTRNVMKATVSPSGDKIALIEGEELVMYDLNRWGVDVTPAPIRDALGSSRLDDIAWAPGDALWVLRSGQVLRFDVASGEQLAAFDTGVPDLTFVAPSSDGGLLALGGYRTPVYVVDSRSGEQLARLVADNPDGVSLRHDAFGVAWAGDRRLIVGGALASGVLTPAATRNASTLVWSLAEPTGAGSYWPGDAMLPVAASITPAGERVLIGMGGLVNAYDRTGRLRYSLPASGLPDTSTLSSRDGAVLAVPGHDTVQFVDAASGETRADGPPGLNRPLGLSDDGRFAVLGTSTEVDNAVLRRVVIVDTTTGSVVTSLGGGIAGARAAFTSDGRLAVIPATPVILNSEFVWNSLRVIDVVTGKQIAKTAVFPCVTHVAASHDDTRLAVLGCGGQIALLDLTTVRSRPWTSDKALIVTLADDTTPSVGVAFGPDDGTLIVTRADGRVEAHKADSTLDRLWSFDVGEYAGAPEVHGGMVWVPAAHELGAGSLSGGIVAMPLDPDELVALARSKATRELTTTECEQYLVDVTC